MDVPAGRTEQLSIGAGILAVLLWVAGMALSQGDHIGLAGGLPEESADQVLAYFRENEGTVIAGSWLFLLGSLFFLWFVGALQARLSLAAAPSLRSVIVAGGTATGIFTLGMPLGGLVAALGGSQIDASTAQALNAVEAVFFIGAQLSAAVLLAAAAAVWLQTRTLAPWWPWVTLLVALWLVILPIGWVGLLIGLPVWTVGTSVLLLRERVSHPAPTG